VNLPATIGMEEPVSEPVSFGAVTFTKAGTYTFEVAELDEALHGFEYDTTPKVITVSVIDNRGTLVIDAVTMEGGLYEIGEDMSILVKVENPFTYEVVEKSGTKTWVDNDDENGERPVSITVRLYADNVEIDSVVVTAEDGWNYSFKDLPKYVNEQEVYYSITEDVVTGYTTEINEFDVINTYNPGNTGVSVLKVWDDENDLYNIRPEEVTVMLFANGLPANVPDAVVTLNEANNWRYDWTGLP